MVYLLNHQDNPIIYVTTSRCFGYKQCVEGAFLKQARQRIANCLVSWQRTLMQITPMVYLLNHQDNLIIYVVTSRCFGYRQCVVDAARHCEPFVNPHKQADKIACHLSGHISSVSMQYHSPVLVLEWSV